MNRSRLLSYVAAAVVALPTAYAFAHYAREASELRRLGQVTRVAEAKPSPSATEEKPRPEAEVAKAGEAKPEAAPAEAAPAGEAKPEAGATAKADEKTSDEKKADEKKSDDEVKLARAESKNSGEGSSEEGSSKKKRRKKDSGDEGSSSSDEKKDSGDKVSANSGSGEGSSEEGSSKKKRGSDDGEGDTGDTGQLNLKADQTAEVYVDGRKVGVTPVLSHKVSIGRHRVRFDCLTPDGKKRGSDQRVKVPPLGEVLVEHKCADAE
jgi:type IV secretory pathway VirB10-like protein